MADYTTTPYGTVGKQVVGSALEKAYEQVEGATPITPLPAYTERTGPVQMGYDVQYQGVSPYQTSFQTAATQPQAGGPLLGTYPTTGQPRPAGGPLPGTDPTTGQPFAQVPRATSWGEYSEQLRQPVTQAYEQSLRDIQAQMGGTGLMGSVGYGMHGDTLTRAGEAYGRGLLGADTTAIEMQQEQEKARYSADLAEAQRRQQYGEQQFGWEYGQEQQQADWANQEAARREAYDLQQRAIQEQARLEPYQQYLGLATGAMPAATSATAAQTAAQAAKTQAEAANVAGWMGLAGTGLGVLGSTYGNGGWTFSDIGDLFV